MGSGLKTLDHVNKRDSRERPALLNYDNAGYQEQIDVEQVARWVPGKMIHCPEEEMMSAPAILPLSLKHRLIVRASNIFTDLTSMYTQIGRDHIEFVTNGTSEARSNRNYLTVKAQVIREELDAIQSARQTIEAVGGF